MNRRNFFGWMGGALAAVGLGAWGKVKAETPFFRRTGLVEKGAGRTLLIPPVFKSYNPRVIALDWMPTWKEKGKDVKGVVVQVETDMPWQEAVGIHLEAMQSFIFVPAHPLHPLQYPQISSSRFEVFPTSIACGPNGKTMWTAKLKELV